MAGEQAERGPEEGSDGEDDAAEGTRVRVTYEELPTDQVNELLAEQASRKASRSAVPHQTDDELIARIRQGETRLYAELVRRYRPDVRKIALLMLADGLVTENVVQQTFINAYERLRDFRRGEDFAPWVKAIARNLVRDELKKSSRERGRMALYRDYLIAKLSTVDQGERREQVLVEALGHCRAKLPPVAAQAIQLRYDGELSFDEVASLIGRSAEATRQIVARARIALKVCIERRMREP
jgi:RNA polymerase sigma-70 factor (ECF subfamily)